MSEIELKAMEAAERIVAIHTMPVRRPTIDELEKILAAPDGPPVTIRPDGSVGVGESDALLVARALLARRPSQEGWRAISSAPKGVKVLVGYHNRAGKWRQVIGRYYDHATLESVHEDSGFADAGWYEESETQDEILRTDQEPTHWAPLLPSPPTERERGEEDSSKPSAVKC